MHCSGLELLVKVEDFGIGIPQPEQEMLFNLFFRGSNVTEIPGTGIGLSIAKKFTEWLGGELHFESKQNGGSIFTLHLPNTCVHAQALTNV